MPKDQKSAPAVLAQGAVDFFERICGPAAEELGLALKDKVSAWRRNNALQIASLAEEIINRNAGEIEVHALPRIACEILDESSWNEDRDVQKLWAGLLASSCSQDPNESNLIFIRILSQLTSLQVRVLEYACRASKKRLTPGGWVFAFFSSVEIKDLAALTGIDDIYRIDRELDHLRSLELIVAGVDPHTTAADITPTPLALSMYIRCQGDLRPPNEFFQIEESTKAT